MPKSSNGKKYNPSTIPLWNLLKQTTVFTQGMLWLVQIPQVFSYVLLSNGKGVADSLLLLTLFEPQKCSDYLSLPLSITTTLSSYMIIVSSVFDLLACLLNADMRIGKETWAIVWYRRNVNPVWLSALAELNYHNTSVWPLLWVATTVEVEFYFVVIFLICQGNVLNH